jgi:hypothetical protein
MASGLVVVIGGGRRGQTRRHVSGMSLTHAVPVHAFIPTVDEPSDRPRQLGTEIFEGDFLDIGCVAARHPGCFVQSTSLTWHRTVCSM